MELWNGDLELAGQRVSAEFWLHTTMLDGSDSATIDTPGAFAAWVERSRAVFPDLVFTPVVGPMVSSTGGSDVSIAVH